VKHSLYFGMCVPADDALHLRDRAMQRPGNLVFALAIAPPAANYGRLPFTQAFDPVHFDPLPTRQPYAPIP